jgi:hypothetical protein
MFDIELLSTKKLPRERAVINSSSPGAVLRVDVDSQLVVGVDEVAVGKLTSRPFIMSTNRRSTKWLVFKSRRYFCRRVDEKTCGAVASNLPPKYKVQVQIPLINAVV